MKSRVYLPAHCSSCLRGYLLLATSVEGVICRECGGAVSVVPGGTYAEGDLPLFEGVSAAVHADLTMQSAQQIVAELRDARGRAGSLQPTLLRITDDLPGLRFLIPALYPKKVRPVHRIQMARGMGMLFTLVSARLRRFEAGSMSNTADNY